MPRILHTGDLHINALRRFRGFYLDRMEQTLEMILAKAVEYKVHFIVVAGDIFDRLDVLHGFFFQSGSPKFLFLL